MFNRKSFERLKNFKIKFKKIKSNPRASPNASSNVKSGLNTFDSKQINSKLNAIKNLLKVTKTKAMSLDI